MPTNDTQVFARRITSRDTIDPAGLVVPQVWANAWQLAEFTPNVQIYENADASFGDAGITPEALFDLYSVARKSPLARFYVNVNTGADANNGLTPGTAKKSIGAAIVLANTAAVASQIIVAAGDYNRTFGAYQGGTGAPTVDIAFIASGGTVVCGTWDDFAALSKDATFTNTYVLVLSNANRVVDLTQVDRFGNYVELTPVASNAIANITPNSWAITAGSIYIQRADGAPVTQTNTRIYRANVDNFRVTNPVNIFIGGADNNSAWDFQGGQTGCVRYNPATKPGVNKACVVKNTQMRFGGGTTNTAGNGLAVDSIHGIAAFFNCQADCNWSDGFNFKNSLTPSTKGYMMTVNCGGNDNGRAPSTSNNGWTSHDDVTAIDICGIFQCNRGGTYRSINVSVSWLVDPTMQDDFGDIMAGGTIQPTCFRVDNTARYYVTKPKIRSLKATGFRFYVAAGAYLAYNSAIPSRYPDYNAGTLELF